MFRRRHKFGAKRTEVDGIKFPSKAEATRYLELKQLQEVGAIRELQLQVTFKLHGTKGSLICRYKADFVYFDVELGREVVEDKKGFQTPEFKLKWKMLQDEYGDKYQLRIT